MRWLLLHDDARLTPAGRLAVAEILKHSRRSDWMHIAFSVLKRQGLDEAIPTLHLLLRRENRRYVWQALLVLHAAGVTPDREVLLSLSQPRRSSSTREQRGRDTGALGAVVWYLHVSDGLSPELLLTLLSDNDERVLAVLNGLNPRHSLVSPDVRSALLRRSGYIAQQTLKLSEDVITVEELRPVLVSKDTALVLQASELLCRKNDDAGFQMLRSIVGNSEDKSEDKMIAMEVLARYPRQDSVRLLIFEFLADEPAVREQAMESFRTIIVAIIPGPHWESAEFVELLGIGGFRSGSLRERHRMAKLTLAWWDKHW